MRDLVFRNITSVNKQRRILSSSEVMDKDGVRNIIRRHFICIIREIKNEQATKPSPYLYVLRQQNTKAQEEKFFCRVKAGIYVANKGRLFLILFMHSLKIRFIPIPLGAMK